MGPGQGVDLLVDVTCPAQGGVPITTAPLLLLPRLPCGQGLSSEVGAQTGTRVSL